MEVLYRKAFLKDLKKVKSQSVYDDDFMLYIARKLCFCKSMPRKTRIGADGALNHVTVRGIEGKEVFREDPDRVNCVSFRR